MAASKSILDALSNLNDVILEASVVTRTFTDLAGDAQGTPEWPFAVERMVSRIQHQAEALETLVRQKALPLMTDIEAASKQR